MKTGPLWKISIETSAEAEDAVMEAVERVCGAPASSCMDVETGDITVSAFLEKATHRTKPAKSALVKALNRIRECGLSVAPGRVSVRQMRAEDWAESWKRHFKTLEIGSALLIKPSWSRRVPRGRQVLMVLDPGLSFGTGQHPTTAFCLEQIVQARRSRKQQSLLDIGCGSGILAIAAAKLGYTPVEAFDFDPDAVRIAGENARQNEVLIQLRKADICKLPPRSACQFDVVCANLIFDLLLAQRSRILARVRPEGLLVLAGILRRQFGEVRLAYEEAGWRLVAERVSGEWHSGAFKRVG